MKRYNSLFENKLTSVGTIITDGNNMLVGHATMSKHYDIPKGQQDEGESNLQTAIRELKEEMGITFKSSAFKEVGRFKYNSSKDLFLYKVTIDFNDIDLGKLKCTSYFERYGKQFPEMDSYKIIAIQDISKYCSKVLTRVLINIL